MYPAYHKHADLSVLSWNLYHTTTPGSPRMSDDKRDAATAGLTNGNGNTNGHAHTAATNGHSASAERNGLSPPSSTLPVPSPPADVPSSGPVFVARSIVSLLYARLRALWPVSSSTSVLLASLLFLWLTIDPHRRPSSLRTMLTFGPSAFTNELAHLVLPLVSVPALYFLHRRLQLDSRGQWQLRASVAAHVLSAISLLSLIAKSIASRAAFRYALLHPGQPTEVARHVVACETDEPTNALIPAPQGPTLPAVMSSLSPVKPPSQAAANLPVKKVTPMPPTDAVPASAKRIWSADELAAIEKVGDMDVWRCVQAMLPAPVLSRWKDGVRVDRGVVFHVLEGHKTKQYLKLDVYHPSNSPQSHPASTSSSTSPLPPLFPLVVYIHGGGWITGDKRWGSLPLLIELAHKGHVVVTINYRLAPYARFPSFLIDIKRAIAYAKTHATTAWHADPSRTFLAGESAGGHLATLAALTANNPTYQPGFEAADTSCVAVIDLYGVHSFVKGKNAERVKQEDSFFNFLHQFVLTHSIRSHPSVYHAASPLSAITALLSSVSPASTAPVLPYFFCAHGTNDTLVPVEDTWRFFQAILDARHKHTTATTHEADDSLDVCVDVTGGSHAFNIVYNARTYALNDALGVWMSRVVRAMDERDKRDGKDRSRQAEEVAKWRAVIRAETAGTVDKSANVTGPGTVQAIQLHSSL